MWRRTFVLGMSKHKKHARTLRRGGWWEEAGDRHRVVKYQGDKKRPKFVRCPFCKETLHLTPYAADHVAEWIRTCPEHRLPPRCHRNQNFGRSSTRQSCSRVESHSLEKGENRCKRRGCDERTSFPAGCDPERASLGWCVACFEATIAAVREQTRLDHPFEV